MYPDAYTLKIMARDTPLRYNRIRLRTYDVRILQTIEYVHYVRIVELCRK